MRAATPALERLMGATVRVAGGTGVLVANGPYTVVVTAKHVVTAAQEAARDKDDPEPNPDMPVPVRARAGWTNCAVLGRDDGADLVLLAAPPDEDGHGLVLLGHEMVPGDEVWTCGHPRGWDSAGDPVLCRGIVAGVAAERWANLEASWGNSGGALVLAADEQAALGGIALGRAGDAQIALDEFRARMGRYRDMLASFEGNEEAHQQEGTAMQESLGVSRREIESALADPAETPQEKRFLQLVLGQLMLGAATHSNVGHLRMLIRLTTMRDARALRDVAEFIDDHFRTGFVRFASATAIRKLLPNT